MPSVFQQLKRDVIDVLRSSLMTCLSKFISFIEKTLWESNRPTKSFQIVLYITIWKDIQGLRYVFSLFKLLLKEKVHYAILENMQCCIATQREIHQIGVTSLSEYNYLAWGFCLSWTFGCTNELSNSIWKSNTVDGFHWFSNQKKKRSLHKSKMHYAKKL
jgi:hypothetical protein